MISFAIRNPLLTLAASLALAFAGFWAWRQVPVDAIPDLSDNQVIVWAEWPGKSPQDMEQQVTSRLARELQGLPGVQTVRGMSLYGASYVYVIFNEKRDLYECRTRVLERLSQLGGLLPAGVAPRLGPDATAMGQVYAFTVQGPRDVESKRYVLDQVVIPALRAVPGVAEVAPAGGVVREYQIDVDPLRLEAQGLTLDMLMMAVQEAGRDVGAMSVEQSGVETMIRGVGFVRSAQDVENIVVRGDAAMGGGGVRLGDVANVHLGGQFRQGLLADAREEQVGAIIGMRVHADPKTVITAVKKSLSDLAPALAAEKLNAVSFYDRSQLIEETTETLTGTLREAVVTTVIVVVIFLLHARASLATAVSLPLGMLFSFLVMRLFGVGANIMSLAGIAIAIGVMVDFGIIMTENITQHLVDLQERCKRENRAMPVSPFNEEITDSVVAAAKEVARPLFTSAATTIIGFLPIFALTDQAGRLFEPLALTKSLAITGAVLFGTLLVPALCRLLLPPWQIRKPVLLALAGLAAGATFGWFIRDGWSIPRDHGRWLLTIPGWLCAPVMAALAGGAVWKLGRERLVSYEENPVSHAIHIGYEWAYTRILRHKVAFTVVIALLASAGYLLGLGWPTLGAPLRGMLAGTRLDAGLTRWFPGVGSSFLPPLDEGSLLFMPSIPASGGLGETLRIMKIQNRIIEDTPEVAQVMGKMGRAETALDPAPIGMIETVVVLKPYRDWPAHEFEHPDGRTETRPRTLEEVRNALAAETDMPGVAPSWLQPIETRVVMLSTGIRSLLALQLLGDDSVALERFAESAEKILQGTPGSTDVQMQREGGKPYAEIHLDPERLARFGVTADSVMRSIETALGGMSIASSVEGTQRYPLRIRYARELRDDPDELPLLQIPLGEGKSSIPLSSLLAGPGGSNALTYTIGPMAIRSEGGKRTQYILLNARDAGEVEVVRAADARLRAALGDGRLTLPKGATYRWVGRYEQKLKADATLRVIIAVSMAIMIALIYAGTRSWLITAIIVLCNVLVTTAGGFFFVWWWDAQMTTAVVVGFLVLLGVMFNDGILLGSYIQEQFKTPPKDLDEVNRRVFYAGLRRRRPAIMTNVTTLLSLVPVLWATGRGSELMQPMVLPVVGGMLFDLASLFSVPVFFTWYWERKLLKNR